MTHPVALGTSQQPQWALHSPSGAPSTQSLHSLPTHPPLCWCWLMGQSCQSPSVCPALSTQTVACPGWTAALTSGSMVGLVHQLLGACYLPLCLGLVVENLHYTEEVRVSCVSPPLPLPGGYLHQTSVEPMPWSSPSQPFPRPGKLTGARKAEASGRAEARPPRGQF